MLRSHLGLAVCAAALCLWHADARAGAERLRPAKSSNSSIAVSKSKKPAPPTPAAASHAIPPLPDKKSAAMAAPAPAVWKPEEIAAAQARCTAILKDIDAVTLPQPPIREGRCGAAAPIRLISVGKNPQVAFSPPALVNCEFADTLHGWIKNDVQPLAMKRLGAKIIRIEVMSDYSCRTAMGRVGNNLSEHAFANALDLGAFVTEKGETTSVLNGWGTPKREIAERIAAEAAAKAKAEQDRVALATADAKARENLKDAKPAEPAKTSEPQAKKPPAPVAVASSLGTPAAGGAKRVRSNGVDKITVTLPGAARSPSEDFTKLGGPKSPSVRKPDAAASVAALSIVERPPGPQAQFLHEAHAAACRLFGTTLGPEANADHRNHFHVDMAERKYKKICD